MYRALLVALCLASNVEASLVEPLVDIRRTERVTSIHRVGVFRLTEGLLLYIDFWEDRHADNAPTFGGHSQYAIVKRVKKGEEYDYCLDEYYFRAIARLSEPQAGIIPDYNYERGRPVVIRCHSDGSLVIALRVRSFVRPITGAPVFLFLKYDQSFLRKPFIMPAIVDPSDPARSVAYGLRVKCACRDDDKQRCIDVLELDDTLPDE